MDNGFGSGRACVAVGALMAWLSLGPARQSREMGSEVPCAVPLSWRVTRVDAEFGLDVDEAITRVREASALWERSVGRALFTYDPTNGFPVRLVYDERQARTQERAKRERALEEGAATLEARRAELETSNEALLGAQARYEEDGRAYEGRLAEHNAMVRRWNERGGAPEDVGREMEATARELQAERRDVERRARSLEDDMSALRRDEQRFNRSATEHTELGEALARDFPPTPVQSGEYREAVTRENGRLVSVSREIRIYRFAGVDDLRLVLAHELGHALGLGHSRVPTAVMSERHDRGAGGPAVSTIHADDIELLRARCPDLAAAAAYAPLGPTSALSGPPGVRSGSS